MSENYNITAMNCINALLCLASVLHLVIPSHSALNIYTQPLQQLPGYSLTNFLSAV